MDTNMQQLKLFIIMDFLKLIKIELNINFNLQEKFKHMTIHRNLLKFQDNLELKWKNKDYMLISEQIELCIQEFILILICGLKEEQKLLCTFKDLQEECLRENKQTH